MKFMSYTLDGSLKSLSPMPRCRNEPNVHKMEMRGNDERWHGSQLSLIIAGHWTPYRAKILTYLRQIAVITPYAQFRFKYSAAEDERNSVAITFVRRTQKMPVPPAVRSSQ